MPRDHAHPDATGRTAMNSKHTRSAPAPEVQVTVRGGEVPVDSRDYAAEKIGHVAAYSARPVLYAHVVLEVVADPARTRPALAEATLDVNGTPLRAHVAAAGMHEAVDLLEGRLRRQLVQLEGRVQNRHHRTGVAGEHEWRHGDLPQERPEYRARPVEERTVVRHKMLALHATTPDEAVGDMEQVGHDFFLFTDRSSGQDAVVYRLTGGGYGGHTADGTRLHPGTSGGSTLRRRPARGGGTGRRDDRGAGGGAPGPGGGPLRLPPRPRHGAGSRPLPALRRPLRAHHRQLARGARARPHPGAAPSWAGRGGRRRLRPARPPAAPPGNGVLRREGGRGQAPGDEREDQQHAPVHLHLHLHAGDPADAYGARPRHHGPSPPTAAGSEGPRTATCRDHPGGGEPAYPPSGRHCRRTG